MIPSPHLVSLGPSHCSQPLRQAHLLYKVQYSPTMLGTIPTMLGITPAMLGTAPIKVCIRTELLGFECLHLTSDLIRAP